MTSNNAGVDATCTVHGIVVVPEGAPRECSCRQTYAFRTVRVCDRCRRELPYDGQWVKLDFIKGHKTLSSEMACWGCFLGWGRLSK